MHRSAQDQILVADDNADMRDYVARLLHANYDVQTVSDGEAALRAVPTARPDLLLSDVMMPRLDGFALLSAIRSDPLLRDLPVILVSARAGDEARIDGLEASADDYLVKPFSARELLARVRSNLDMAEVRQQAAEQIRAEAHRLEVLNRTGMAIAAELDLDRLVQTVTDAAVELTDAKFGAFFYNVVNDAGEAYTLCDLGCNAGGIRRVRDAAQHGGVRADIPRHGYRPFGQHPAGSALWRQRAALRHAARPSSGLQLPCRSGRFALRRGAGWPVLRSP